MLCFKQNHEEDMTKEGKDKRSTTTTSGVSSVDTNIPNAALVPDEVINQLNRDFLPAVKGIATTGQELLKTYQALERNSLAYINALEQLATSSKKGGKTTAVHGKTLHEMLKEYKKIVEAHNVCVKDLSGIVSKTTVYSTEEKDKLKQIQAQYHKEVKDLQKQKQKGTKSTADVDAFHQKNAKEFLRQQELRYKFFSQHHQRWFGKYAQLVANVTVAGETPIVSAAETPKLNGVPPAAEEAKKEEAAPEVQEVVAVVENHASEKADEDVVVERRDTLAGSTSSRTTVSEIIHEFPSRRPTNEDVPGVVLVSETKTEVMVPDAKPVVSQAAAVNTVPVAAVRDERPVQFVTAPTQTYQQVPAQQPVHVQVDSAVSPPRSKFDYRGPIIQPAPMPRQREPEILHRENPVIVPRTVDAPVYRQPAYNERPHYHVESQYNPSVSPAHRPTSQYIPPKPESVVVPTMFKASDYGRVLTVTQDFNATSGEQMTVNRGDQVILIKSGSRGWIFIQDQATQRTGWIPAPFVTY